jgi:hypothetical protein
VSRIQCAVREFIVRGWRKSRRILSRELNPEPPGYEAGSPPDRAQSSTSGRLMVQFRPQETEASSCLFCSCVRDVALVGSASFRRRFWFSVNLGALTGLNKRGPHTGSLLRNSHTYTCVNIVQYSLAPT